MEKMFYMKKMMKWASVSRRVLSFVLIVPLYIGSVTAQPQVSYRPYAVDKVVVTKDDFRQYGRRQPAGTWRKHIVKLRDVHGKDAYFTCDAIVNLPPSDNWNDPDDGPDWDLFYERAAGLLQQCNWAPHDQVTNEIDYQNVATIFIYYSSRNKDHERALSVALSNFPIAPTPVSCTSYVDRDIDFGSVSLSASYVPVMATGTVRSVCDQKALISVSVNGGSGLNNIDGSQILFDYPRTFELESGVVGMTDIHAVLSRPPGRPGAYKWYAPVIIEYH
ncbi:hypothetical protein BOO21_12670 [Vibrio cidicii]|nr:hypothetical protein [Vibrio cidicii]